MGITIYNDIPNSYISSAYFVLEGHVKYHKSKKHLEKISISTDVEWKEIQLAMLKKVILEYKWFEIEVNAEKFNVLLVEFSNFDAIFYLQDQKIKI